MLRFIPRCEEEVEKGPGFSHLRSAYSQWNSITSASIDTLVTPILILRVTLFIDLL